jgi:hypothetical protein
MDWDKIIDATTDAIGLALQPLRDEGVFILGSGMSYHNMHGFDLTQSRPRLRSTPGCPMMQSPADRERSLLDWATIPKSI